MSECFNLKQLLPTKIYEVVDRAGISTPKQIIVLSKWDIKKLTNLCTDDIVLLKNIAADCIYPASTTFDKLLQNKNTRVTTGCASIDNILNGGLRKGTLTEIYGESGSGKTQIGLQTAAHNWHPGSVYICTEDLFPVKRFEQIKHTIPNYKRNIDYGKNIFVEHITEANDLLSCVRVRLPKLLEKNNLSVIILDSVAAPFRSEYTNYIQRAEILRELAISLLIIAQSHNLAILCINQVTASFSNSDDVLPSLGLAWTNMISTRLWLKKTDEIIKISKSCKTDASCNQISAYIRHLHVIFSSDLPNSIAKFLISEVGVCTL